MKNLVLHTNPTAQWHALVNEAQVAANCRLEEDLESYLVFVLMRFAGAPELAARVMALDYLQSILASGRQRETRLRDVGDQCLLYSGLFPEQAEHRRVSIDYFVDLGRTAYHELSALLQNGSAQIFNQLATDFVRLMDVLLAMREMGNKTLGLEPLKLLELRAKTGSRYAFKVLGERVNLDVTALDHFVDSLNSSTIKSH